MKKPNVLLCIFGICLFNLFIINFHLYYSCKKNLWIFALPKRFTKVIYHKNSLNNKIINAIGLKKTVYNTPNKILYSDIGFLPFENKQPKTINSFINNSLLTNKVSGSNSMLSQKNDNYLNSSINKLLEFSGSRTIIVNYSNNSPNSNISNNFSREDYLILHIRGKDKLKNIKADIIENNILKSLENKTKIEMIFNNTNIFLGENHISFNENDLLLDHKTVYGLDFSSTYKNLYFRFLSGYTNTDNVEEELKGNGTQGPYYLKNKSIYPYSEVVKIDNTILSRDIDYTIDYNLGIIKFCIKYIKNSGNVSLAYKTQNEIKKNILGIETSYRLSPAIGFGFDYLKQYNGKTNNSIELIHDIYGLKFNYDNSRSLSFNSYLAVQKTFVKDLNLSLAEKINFLYNNRYLFMKATYKNSGAGFKSLGTMELYPNSNQSNINLSFKNKYFDLSNNIENKNLSQATLNTSKRHANSSLKLFLTNYFNFMYNFTHDEDLFSNDKNQNLSKAIHSVQLGLNKSIMSWETSWLDTKIYKTNNFSLLKTLKSNFILNTKYTLINLLFEGTNSNRLVKSRECGISFESKHNKNLHLKTNYNKYFDNAFGYSDYFQLDYRLNCLNKLNTYGNLSLKTISDINSDKLMKNKDISGIIKFVFMPSQKITLDYTYIPQTTKNSNNNIVKNYSMNQLNLFLTPSKYVLWELKSQNNFYYSNSDNESLVNNHTNKSYFLRCKIKLNNSLDIDNQYTADTKTYDHLNIQNKNSYLLNTSIQINTYNLFNLGYKYENDDIILNNSFNISYTHKNTLNTFKYLTLLNISSCKYNNTNEKSTNIETRFELTATPKPNIELNFNYNYSKQLNRYSNSKNTIDASISSRINKYFDFKLNASYYKNTQPNIKNINIESVFTTSFQ